MTKKTTNLTQLKSFELGDTVYVWFYLTGKYYPCTVIGRARETWEGKQKTWKLWIDVGEHITGPARKVYVWYNTYNNRLEFEDGYASI